VKSCLFFAAILLLLAGADAGAQRRPPVPLTPPARVRLIPAPSIRLTGDVDSSSPAVWDGSDGSPRLFVVTSTAGRPSRASGEDVSQLGDAEPVELEPWPIGGVWMEAVIPDVNGTWYGFFHNEVPATEICGDDQRVYPRIGAARSVDQGATWTNLGVIFEASPDTFVCDTGNTYFVGGVGDLTALLDADQHDVYIYFSQYGREVSQEGIAVLRLPWADTDNPVGKVTVWNDGVWLPPDAIEDDTGELHWVYPSATPILPTGKPWHTGEQVDQFWGPSIHWNEGLQQYVMLMNRARDDAFSQEGIYVSFNERLDAPASWSTPLKIIDGGGWYPQVIGLELSSGTDRWAATVARFFMSGWSDYYIEFSPAE